MPTKQPELNIKKIKQNAIHRRFAISVAGARGGARLLTNRASSLFLSADEKQAAHKQALAKEAQLFTDKLGELKGTYVKIGQMMALYGDHLLPKEVAEALHDLEHKTTSFKWSVIEPVIKEALGDKFQDLDIDHQALAAASLAQVHRATTLSDGQVLCIKVQYPGVAETIESDFNAVLQMLRFARWAKSGRDMDGWMQEIKAMLVDEVDYQREAIMTQRIAKLLSDDVRYIVPTIEADYSNKTILTMDYLSGVEVSHPSVMKLSQARRNALAVAMLEVFFKEIFEWGIMQTDPNFGNYRIQLRSDTSQQDKLVLLDFGAVRELEKTFLKALCKTIIAAHQNNRIEVIGGAIALNCLDESQADTAKESFADFCILLLEPFRKDKSNIPNYALNAKNQYKWSESNLLKRVGKLGAKSIGIDGFSAPPKEFALIARKLAGVFSFVTTLRAEINAHKILEQYL